MGYNETKHLFKEIAMTTKALMWKITDFQHTLRVINAVRKGLKIETIDHADGRRSYYIDNPDSRF